ncbi:MAG: glutaredoxin family protein [Gammaproteobacteria bacterium]
MKTTLYTTLGCHLCEQALSQLYELQREGLSVDIHETEIADSEVLLEKYSLRIPVVAAGAKEIGWPFTLPELRAFLLAQD